MPISLSIPTPGGASTWDVEVTCDKTWTQAPPAATGMAADVAVANLYHLTGGRFGIYTTTFRPCAPTPPRRLSTYASVAASTRPVRQSSWPPSVLSSCPTCPPATNAELVLPTSTPLRTVEQVVIDGVAVEDMSEFAIFDSRTVIWRSPTDEVFPSAQDLSLPTTEEGTWSITVTHGLPLPAHGPAVVGHYACQILNSLLNKPCSLPTTTRSVTRQGFAFQLVNEEYLLKGLVGDPIVDHFIITANPHRLRSQSTAFSPDTVPSRPLVETWTGTAPDPSP